MLATKSRTTITLDSELLKELTEMAREEERSFSNQIVYLVRKGKEHIDAQGKVNTERSTN